MARLLLIDSSSLPEKQLNNLVFARYGHSTRSFSLSAIFWGKRRQLKRTAKAALAAKCLFMLLPSDDTTLQEP